MPTILIGGYYGAGNIGDETILEAMVVELRAQRPDLSFIATSWNPEKTSEELKIDAFFWKDIEALLAAALQADLIILGGGGIFHDYWGLNPETYLRMGFSDITAYGSLPLLAKLLDIPCMIYAVGVGPFQSSIARHHTRIAFERCQIATLRDTESLEFLKQTGFDIINPNRSIVKVLPDPVFSFTTSIDNEALVSSWLHQRKIKTNTPLLGISLRYWDLDFPFEEWLSLVTIGVQIFLKKNIQVKVILIPFQTLNATPYTNDVTVLERFADLLGMPDRILLIKEPTTSHFVQALIKRCDVLLGMRLHSIIMGINVGTPVVALSYAPKVGSLMKRMGLENFCIESLHPSPDKLATQLENAWNQDDESRLRTNTLREELAKETKEHASLALKLLSSSHRSKLQFPQQFAIQQIKLLLQADKDIKNLQNELREKDRIISLISAQLAVVASPNFQKLARLYYYLVKETPLKHLYRFIVSWKRAISADYVVDEDSAKIVKSVVSELNNRSLKGVFVITSTFVFDELINQRVLNLSKFLSEKKWGVVYVAWRWNEAEEMPSTGKEVYKNIFQVPVDIFLSNVDVFGQIQFQKKYFIVEFPHPNFFISGLILRRNGYEVVYEIIDEWEEFQKVGHAVWFRKSFENAFVANANFVSAVSPSLIKKFSSLRQDIHLSPNGYSPELLGIQNRNIALKRRIRKNIFNLGYFGYLTDSWFDWEFLFRVLDLADEKNFNLSIHLIGNGEPDQRKQFARYSNRLKFYGKIHPSELYKFVKNWDAAMIWFKPGKLSDAVDPIKIYEYLYFGLPTIVKGMDRLMEFPLTSIVADENQALDALIAIREENLKHLKVSRNFIPTIEQFLSKCTWEQRFTNLLEIIENERWISY